MYDLSGIITKLVELGAVSPELAEQSREELKLKPKKLNELETAFLDKDNDEDEREDYSGGEEDGEFEDDPSVSADEDGNDTNFQATQEFIGEYVERKEMQELEEEYFSLKRKYDELVNKEAERMTSFKEMEAKVARYEKRDDSLETASEFVGENFAKISEANSENIRLVGGN